MNSTPATSNARRTAKSLGDVMEVSRSASSARRIVRRLTADWRERSSAVHLMSARAALNRASPCRNALFRMRALPAALRGPVLFCALRRLAAIFAGEVTRQRPLNWYRVMSCASAPYRMSSVGGSAGGVDDLRPRARSRSSSA